jgi:hypothetical protein
MKVRIQGFIACERIRHEPAVLWEKVVELPDRPLVNDHLSLDVGPHRHSFAVRKVTWDEEVGQFVAGVGVMFLTDANYDEFVRAGLWTPLKPPYRL